MVLIIHIYGGAFISGPPLTASIHSAIPATIGEICIPTVDTQILFSEKLLRVVGHDSGLVV